MKMKRTFSQKSNSATTPTKKVRTVDINNSLHKTLRESGLTLKHPPDKCKASEESVKVIRSIKKNLEKHLEYPANVSTLFSNLEKECQDLDIFKHYLFPNIVRTTDGEKEDLKESVFKILLNIPILQSNLIDYIFEKAIDLTVQSKCEPWIHMILKCFSGLDNIVYTEKLASNLINLLDITSEKLVQLEIITTMPDILGDQEHNNISLELSRILSEDHNLIPAILECLSYLCLSDEQYEQLQKKTLGILLNLSKCNYFPNFVKFLLIPSKMSDNAYLEAVKCLRNSLSWPVTTAAPQDIASSQVFTATAMRNSMIYSKVIANAWLKVASNCKVSSDQKTIDLVILLILSSTSEERQKQVENVIKKLIKSDILKEDLLDDIFEKFSPIFKFYLKHLIELANSLLKNITDPVIVSFASHMYTLMLKLEDCCQTIVAELLQFSEDFRQCLMSILVILNTVAAKDMSLLKQQSVRMLDLLNRTDDMSPDEVRAVTNLLCGLAYSYENSVIRDDIKMIITKELFNSDLKMMIQGVLAGVHAIKYLMATNDNGTTSDMPHDSDDSIHLPEGDIQEAVEIIKMISNSTKEFPDMTALFYDELSKIISSAAYINNYFLAWLKTSFTHDFQHNFIVDALPTEQIGELKLCMQHCINSDSEVEDFLAINIAGLALQPYNEISIGILSPLFQLVQTLYNKQYDGDLSNIDALLGCAIVMPKYDIDMIEDMDSETVINILNCLVHCVNWFRELINAFATEKTNILQERVLKRIIQIEELQKTIGIILIRTKVSYKSPVSAFNINKYTGEHVENKLVKVQNNKQKTQKKNTSDESVLPETSRTQQTQPTVKNKIDATYNIGYRQLNLNVIKLLNIEISREKDSETELTITTLNFLILCINEILESILVSKIKRNTFLSKQEATAYDPQKAEICAKAVSNTLPKLVEHIKFLTSYLDDHSLNCHDDDVSLSTMEYTTCLENIYNMLTIFFKWIGFRNQNNALLKTSLRTVANSDSATISLKDLLIIVAEKFEKHENYCLQLSTAVALIELIKTMHTFTNSKHILKILRNMAQNFLSQQWKTPDGGLEKGLWFNHCVDTLTSIYFMNKEILALKTLAELIKNDIQNFKTRNDTLSSLKCINKANFPIFYRNLGTAVHEATKSCLDKGMTDSEHLVLWEDVAIIMKHMSDIARTLQNRNNLSAFFKRSIPILKLFVSQGIPILELRLKNKTQEVLKVMKILQQSTRFLQTLCCHSRLKKDMALISKVPFVRQLLETLIYKVKAALAANNCSEAFWLGTLENKTIDGTKISSQETEQSEESVEDCDELLPEDECSESDTDDEMVGPESGSISDIQI